LKRKSANKRNTKQYNKTKNKSIRKKEKRLRHMKSDNTLTEHPEKMKPEEGLLGTSLPEEIPSK